MTNQQFSDQFDVQYNAITSNMAPGLDMYEKSVFITRALDEIVKAYLEPLGNKYGQGYDGSPKRQMDFSMLTRTLTFLDLSSTTAETTTEEQEASTETTESEESAESTTEESAVTADETTEESETSETSETTETASEETTKQTTEAVIPYPDTQNFYEAIFDFHSNTKSIALPSDALMIVGEQATVDRTVNKKTHRIVLQVNPLTYTDYMAFNSKTLKRPYKWQAWRILNTVSTNNGTNADIIIGPDDTLVKYQLRYLRMPRAVRLTNLTNYGVTLTSGHDLNNTWEEQSCELPVSIHEEILQRAVELARVAYVGTIGEQLTSAYALGASGTNISAGGQSSKGGQQQ